MIFGFKSGQSEQTENSEHKNLVARLRHGLRRTQSTLLDGISDLLPGKISIDEQFLEGLEEKLLTADLGIKATAKIIDHLSDRIQRNEIKDPAKLKQLLLEIMLEILQPVQQPLRIPSNRPFIILMTGVNGVGKTTSAGKLAKHLLDSGHSVMLAAGDTFRAAAVEQLQAWGDKNQIPVIAQHNGTDSAAVIYDALQAARARDIEVLIADTAGRLHTQDNLMEELKKIRKIISKFDDEIAIECMLVVDAGTGQNVLAQARQFNEAIGITGITLTKLDGTAKGGIIFALAMEMGIPVRYIGVCEQLEDLQEFDHAEFVEALLEY